MSKTLIAYFSASGVTRKLAEKLARSINADIYEIKPAVPYTKSDLNWMDKKSRSTVEMQDHNSRPDISENSFSIQEYYTIFLGFPIWWYIAPTIINTFLEKHDFSNKKIILFATSGGSRFGRTIENLTKSVAESAKIIEGDVLNPNTTEQELKAWAEKF